MNRMLNIVTAVALSALLFAALITWAEQPDPFTEVSEVQS